MDIPFHYHATNDPATKRRDRREFQTANDADEYSAQLQIDQARNAKPVPSLDAFQGKNLGKLGDGSAPPQPNNDVYGMTKPGGVLGESVAGQNAFKYEQEQAAQAQAMEQSKKVGEFLFQFADKHGLEKEGRADLIRGLVNVGVPTEALKQAEKFADELEARKTTGGNSLGKSSVAAAFEFTQQHPELVEKTKSVIKSLRNQGLYSDDLLNNLETMADSDVRQTNSTIAGILKSTESAVRTIEETLPGKTKTAAATTAASTRAGIETKGELSDISAGIAQKIKEAQNFAGEKVPTAEINKLTGEQSIFSNLKNAQEQFDKNWATRYAGKMIKTKWLRQNDEEFNGFLTNLALSMNEYRRQNFGTAQTNSEIQNFLEVINTDLSIKPEAFKKQLGTLLNAMERDYTQKVGVLKEQKYGVTPNLETIGKSKENYENKTSVPQEVIQQALDALQDPDATEEVKNAAKRILTGIR